MEPRNWRVAVVGSGPSGLYATEALAKRGAQVDVFEQEFAPFGLVRYGVAPDHSKIKKTQLVFERILALPFVRLFAGVQVGEDITVEELVQQYDHVLFAQGSSSARDLGVPGEKLDNCVGATELVNWYNGHPRFVHAAPNLDVERALVVGMGNVAIDVARILVRNPDDFASTDISPFALNALKKSRIREVILLARRGPNQAAFEEKEVRELAALHDVSVQVDGYITKRKTPKSEFIAQLPRVGTVSSVKKRVILRFCFAPVEVLGQGKVEAVRVERTALVESAAQMRASRTGDYSQIECGLVVKAIGYQGEPLPGVPYCEATGTIPNLDGRVLDRQDGSPVPGLYVTGWAKRGPTGLIGTNKSCANETVALMQSDLDQVGPLHDPEAIVEILRARKIAYFDRAAWQKLNEWEIREGEKIGAARKKILSKEQAQEILMSQRVSDY